MIRYLHLNEIITLFEKALHNNIVVYDAFSPQTEDRLITLMHEVFNNNFEKESPLECIYTNNAGIAMKYPDFCVYIPKSIFDFTSEYSKREGTFPPGKCELLLGIGKNQAMYGAY